MVQPASPLGGYGNIMLDAKQSVAGSIPAWGACWRKYMNKDIRFFCYSFALHMVVAVGLLATIIEYKPAGFYSFCCGVATGFLAFDGLDDLKHVIRLITAKRRESERKSTNV